MFTPSLSFSLVLVFLTQIIFTDGQKNFNCHLCEGSRTNEYSRNLNNLLSIITSNTKIDNGFYNFSLGQQPNKVYVMAVCRRDLSEADCRRHINDAASKFRQICLTNNESIGFYSTESMFRYSYKPILDTKFRESNLNCTYTSPWSVPEPYVENFKQKATNLFGGLIRKAAAGDSSDKSAVGAVNVTASLGVYAATMCSPDLSRSYCFTCLKGALRELQVCCSIYQGAGIYLPGCIIEFENYPFFSLASMISKPPVLSPFTPPRAHRRSKLGRDIYIVVGVVVALLTTAGLFLYFSRRTKQNKEVEIENNDQIRCVDFRQFDFIAVEAATDNFSDAKSLSKGSSATVYKGMLPGGQEIVVKRLSKIDKDIELKFNNEVLLLTNLQHKNLVKLLGFCVQEDVRLLIYEFLPNESLDRFLRDPAKRANLDWETRYNVIQGIARGLSYLHEDSQLRVIHRDLKPSKILLGVEMKPKISNFSKASHVHEDQTRGATSTIKGTCGYMPPEYVQQGQFSVKSDVFSFGVLLLEIIRGQMIRSFSEGENDVDLLSYAWSKWSKGTALDVVDPTLERIESQNANVEMHKDRAVMRSREPNTQANYCCCYIHAKQRHDYYKRTFVTGSCYPL